MSTVGREPELTQPEGVHRPHANLPVVVGAGELLRLGIGIASSLATWTWALVVLAALVLIRRVGEGWWGVTVLLFFPRWLFLVPLPVLAIASGITRRRRQWPVQGTVALTVAGPLMVLSLPLETLWEPPPAGTRVRIMTLNRGPNPLDFDRMVELIEGRQVDLICFQEGHLGYNYRLEAYLESHGWYHDRGSYVASRYPIIAELPRLPHDPDPHALIHLQAVRVLIRAPDGGEFALVSVHMPTLRFGLYRLLLGDVAGLKQHTSWWDRQLSRLRDGLEELGHVPVLVGGDFNAPPDHPGIAALRSTYRFAFEEAGWGYGYTRPSRYPWFRIDHILASPDCRFTKCQAGPDVGSDHLPLIAEAVLPAAAPGLPRAARESPGKATP